MNAPLNNSQMKLLMAETLSFRTPAIDSPVSRQPASMLRQLASRIANAWHRRTVMDELSTLTDRELTDIGLSRADLGRVFDPRFVRERHI